LQHCLWLSLLPTTPNKHFVAQKKVNQENLVWGCSLALSDVSAVGEALSLADMVCGLGGRGFGDTLDRCARQQHDANYFRRRVPARLGRAQVERMQDRVGREDHAARVMLAHTPRWRAALERAGRGDEAWAALCNEIERRARQAWGLEASGAEAAVSALVDASALPEVVWRDEHVLGWFHQGWSSVERDESFAVVADARSAHVSVLAPTQLYTPRWIADWLAEEALARCAPREDRPPECIDPAMGGGQLLLAWLGALEARGWCARGAEALVGAVRGVELDPRAADVARRGVRLWLERRFGALSPAVEAALAARLEVGDGLEAGERVDVALSNPPYMGRRVMPQALRERLMRGWAPFHMDLCAAFVRRCGELGQVVGLLIQQTFWFLSQFEPARAAFEATHPLATMLHLGSRVFPGLSGEKASVVASVHEAGAHGEAASFLDLRELDTARATTRITAWRAGERPENAYKVKLTALAILPGKPLAYWLPQALMGLFNGGVRLGELAHVPGVLNKTSDNARFVRRWEEVEREALCGAQGLIEGSQAGRWRFYSKGGKYAPWWGSWRHVVDWSEEARAHYARVRTASLMEARWWGMEGLCYTDFGGARFNARWLPAGCICDMTGPGIFVMLEDEEARRRRLYMLLALLNSTPARMMLNALNPTLHYQVRDVRNLPLPVFSDEDEQSLAAQAQALVAGWRGVYGAVKGEPCFVEGTGWREEAARLEEVERALHREVCRLYGVEEFGEGALPRHRVIEELERSGR
jgi:hypothetical protein